MTTYLFAFLTSAAIAVSFRAPRRAILWAGVGGMAGWAGYDLPLRAGAPPALAVFLGALALGTVSELLARRLREPTTLFIIPGLFPLVPGLIAYNGMLLLSREEIGEAAQQISRALFFAGALAAGLAVPPALFRRRS
ncbi:MAG: threonine/serine exporter family protein [Bacillota bacterium]